MPESSFQECFREISYPTNRQRLTMPSRGRIYRDPTERLGDFCEVVLPFTLEQARYEASRCLNCKAPAECAKACPVDNDIPTAMWYIAQGAIVEASRVFKRTNSFPEICGRICPHEKLCEHACLLNRKSVPTAIGALEAFAADYEREHGVVETPCGLPTGRRVAVVGGGPSGLACAERLMRAGHAITVFEMRPVPGGLMVYGIPGFKLESRYVFERMCDLARSGVRFETGVRIGRDRTLDDLFTDGFDAVYIAVGAGIDAPLSTAGEDLPGVYKATEFLIGANVAPENLPEGITAAPQVDGRVVVIGGGDTASDCLRTALRLGAEEVICVYRRTEAQMPGASKDRELAREEGARFEFLTQPLSFIAGPDGKLAAIECVRMKLGKPDESGRRRPIPVEGSNFVIETNTVVKALGYQPDPAVTEMAPHIKTHRYGLLIVDHDSGATSHPGVFAGGDAVLGADLVVRAMADGHKAAAGIHAYLMSLGRKKRID